MPKPVKKKGAVTAPASKEVAPSSPLMSAEVQEQFEVELFWCIQKLQQGLNLDKASKKQVQESTKVLNSLMSHSTPFVKKRQLMRTTFGDYRGKMQEEEAKSRLKVKNIKVNSASPSTKSMFLKKSAQGSGGNTFKFNFKVQENVEDQVQAEETVEKVAENRFHFENSDNSFRFGFNTTNS